MNTKGVSRFNHKHLELHFIIELKFFFVRAGASAIAYAHYNITLVGTTLQNYNTSGSLRSPHPPYFKRIIRVLVIYIY